MLGWPMRAAASAANSLRLTPARERPIKRVRPISAATKRRTGSSSQTASIPLRMGRGQNLDLRASLVGQLERLNAVAKALAGVGVTAVALDMRGRGGSGTRSDIDDDFADLVATLRKA
jgi:hypothetical protein